MRVCATSRFKEVVCLRRAFLVRILLQRRERPAVRLCLYHDKIMKFRYHFKKQLIAKEISEISVLITQVQ